MMPNEPTDPERHGPETSGRSEHRDPNHWSREVRRRVRQRMGGDEPGTNRQETTATPGAGEAIRSRVEARLREAEAARAERNEREAAALPAIGPTGVPDPLEETPEGAANEAPLEPIPEEEEAARPATAPRASGVPRFAAAIATCAGIGKIPLAPGTFGSLAGLGAFLLTSGLPVVWQAGLLGFSTLLGWWAAGRYAAAVNRKDPSEVVVDEFCGMWLALVASVPGFQAAFGAFLLFRVLDIAKPPPIRQLERLPGGLGILADDLGAGLVVRLLLFLFLAM